MLHRVGVCRHASRLLHDDTSHHEIRRTIARADQNRHRRIAGPAEWLELDIVDTLDHAFGGGAVGILITAHR